MRLYDSLILPFTVTFRNCLTEITLYLQCLKWKEEHVFDFIFWAWIINFKTAYCICAKRIQYSI